MASEGFLSLSVVEDVLKQHGTMMSDIDLASRKEEEAATRRYEAAGWLRRMVGVVGARDLPEEPTEEEFRLGLRNGIVLCNALNKDQPGAVPKVVEAPVDPTLLPDGAALSAYQYFENLRNFLDALEELGLPTFEASDLERGGKGSRVVNSVLALKSYGEHKEGGRNGSCKYGGVLKPSSCGKHFARRNFEPFMNSLARNQSADKIQDSVSVEENLSIDFSLESTEMTSHSLNMLVRTILSNKKPEEVPSLVESMLSKVMQEFECRIASQNDLVTTTAKDQTDGTISLSEENNLPETSSSCCEIEMVKAESTSPSLKDESFSISLKDGETSNTKLLKQGLLFDGHTSSTKLLKQGLLFDRQKTEILELKDALVTTRAGIELMKTQYSEELSNLGKHMRILAHAVQGYHKILEENRKLYNQVQDLKGNIRVYCRVRPFLPGQSNLSTVGHIDDGSITILTPPKYGKEGHKSFTFNKVFGPFATQEEVFSDTQPLIRSVLDGYNVCIFAYGQTGAGKTYTMSGPKVLTEQSFGVNYRALNDLFHISKERKDTFCYEISVQMIEIYNEQVRDLLASDGPHKRLDIRNSSQTGFAVPDANSVPVTSTTEVIELMDIGQKNRAVSATSMNDRSSRSHSCLTIHVQGRELASGVVVRGCMHLVDLAGSERVNKSEVKGDRLKEAQHINKSLAALGDVISALAQKSSHIPYRNSKLTQLLQDSLGGQAKTLMFVHISPEVDAVSETLSTLKFAERVAMIELGAAQVNKDNGEVKELRLQVASLKAALAKKESEHLRSAMSSPDIYGMKSGATSPAHPNHMQTMEDFGNIEVRSCSALMQERADMDLQDLLTASDSSSWPERYPKLLKFGSKETGEDVIQNEDALSAWEGDNPHVPDSFYQGYIPDVRAFGDQHRSRANCIATEDLDDLDFATSESSEQDVLSQSNLPKSSNAVDRIKRPQSGSVKSSDVRSASRSHLPSPSRKISNAPGQTVSRSTRQPISGGIDGKRRPNAKTGSRK
ncbi:kinesin-like protein KIN-14P [Musa acuminata AAA Group]|uniref:kinesin-like protein KIN-14P n=1 Tax=Musa acuminata AAA Group TaxID=214697 RepID=UPI0031D51BA6